MRLSIHGSYADASDHVVFPAAVKKNPITWLLSVGTIIDEKETKKTGLGLIFVGILFIIVSIYLIIRDCNTPNPNVAYIFSFFCIGIIIIIIGEILRRLYFR